MFDDLANKHFRDAFLEENIRNRLAFQIRALREKNEWSQPLLAEKSGKTQSVISRLEDPNYGRFTLRTLLDMASAFDVALFVSFVPYSKLIAEIKDVSPDALAVASYRQEKKAFEESSFAVEAANTVLNALSSVQELSGSAYKAALAEKSPTVKFGATLGNNQNRNIRVPKNDESLLGGGKRMPEFTGINQALRPAAQQQVGF